jgi:hypothetical protein
MARWQEVPLAVALGLLTAVGLLALATVVHDAWELHRWGDNWTDP